ncbi:MAG: hypothetical protein ACK40G_18130 [Cytophagaceae bacterium]
MEQFEQSSLNKRILIIAGLVISIIANLFLSYKYLTDKQKITFQEKEIIHLKNNRYSNSNIVESKVKELNNLKGELERISTERKKLGLSNDSLNKQISGLKGTINSLKNKSKLDKSEIEKLNKLIAELKDQIIERDRQIAELMVKNDSLFTDISTLKSENEKLSKYLASTNSVLEHASILKAENISIAGLKENGKELKNGELKGRRISSIKITFNLAENKVAKKGEKNFYVAMTTPSGKVFTDFRNGGGVTHLKNGHDINYTLVKAAKFENKSERIELVMPKGFDYVPGVYHISVYADGHEIGSSSFRVR